MTNRTLAILAAVGATTIYGLNHTIAKGVMPHYVQPFGFILLLCFLLVAVETAAVHGFFVGDR